jgi:hypothetical protein
MANPSSTSSDAMADALHRPKKVVGAIRIPRQQDSVRLLSGEECAVAGEVVSVP